MSKRRDEPVKASEWPPHTTEPVRKLLEYLRDPETSFRSLIDTVLSDSRLTTILIRYASSPAVGVYRGVLSIADAVRLLGTFNAIGIALAFHFMQHETHGCQGFKDTQFWGESLARASTCRFIVSRNECCSPDEAFVCGLHSLIGRVVFATTCAERYGTLLETMGTGDVSSLAEAEFEALGVDHAVLAAQMTVDWGFPRGISDAVCFQNHPLRLPENVDSGTLRLTESLNVAGVAACLFTRDRVTQGDVARFAYGLMRCGFAANEVDATFEAIKKEWHLAGQVFAVPTRSVGTLGQLSACL